MSATRDAARIIRAVVTALPATGSEPDTRYRRALLAAAAALDDGQEPLAAAESTYAGQPAIHLW